MRTAPLTSALLAALFALAFVPAADADSVDLVAACTGPNESVLEDVRDTVADPLHPECGSLTEPCFLQGWSCYGCGPDVVEWVIGPIYCK